jgi:hypothetical protein
MTTEQEKKCDCKIEEALGITPMSKEVTGNNAIDALNDLKDSLRIAEGDIAQLHDTLLYMRDYLKHRMRPEPENELHLCLLGIERANSALQRIRQ